MATLPPEGRGFNVCTEGDAIDEAPSWVPGEPKSLIFQSAGIERDPGGARALMSPYAIYKLNLETNKMDILVEHEEYDSLLPRMSADGSLYYIRRPYQPTDPLSPLKLLQDVLFFPFRVLRAIVHFLNFFSLMFSRKPLITSGGPPRNGPDARFLILWGRVVDTQKLLRQSRRSDAAGELVPASWKLICRKPDQTESVVADHVLAYDLLSDGSIVYSHGGRIFHKRDSTEVKEIASGRLIDRVIALTVKP